MEFIVKERDYYVLGMAVTVTLLFCWIVAVTTEPARFGLGLMRLAVFAISLEKLNAILP